MVYISGCCPHCRAFHNPLLHASYGVQGVGDYTPCFDGECPTTYTYLCDNCGETYWIEMTADAST